MLPVRALSIFLSALPHPSLPTTNLSGTSGRRIYLILPTKAALDYGLQNEEDLRLNAGCLSLQLQAQQRLISNSSTTSGVLLNS